MPEGPEIRSAADKIAKVLENQFVQEVVFGLPTLEVFAAKLTGQQVTGIETRGKALLIHFANQLSIYSHNQLYGVWKVARRGHLPKTNRSLRLALHTKTHSALLYSASDISVWPTRDLHEHPFLSRLGPDILSKDLHWKVIATLINDQQFQGRALSALFLDQRFIAGLGNYLRSEILFDAGIHPDLKAKELASVQRDRLARSTIATSWRACQTGGYTVPSGLLKKLRQAKGRYESIRFMVFNREGLPCRRCTGPINREQRNGRRIYWCPQCQFRQ